MTSCSEFFSETRYNTILFLYEYVKIQLSRPEKQERRLSSLPKILDRLEAIEHELFSPYLKGLKQQAANKNNPLPRNNSSTPEPIEDLFLLKLLALKPLIQDDRALYQHFQSLIQSLKADFRVMKHCVDCIKLWYLHEQSEKDPFAVPCNRPHLLVWMKRENYFWPAKLISIEADKALISLFGATRCIEIVRIDHLMLLTEDYPQREHQMSQRKGSYRTLQKEFQVAMTQLHAHVALLNSLYFDSPLLVYHDPERIHHLKEYVAKYGLHLVRKKEITGPYEVPKSSTSSSPASPHPENKDFLFHKLVDEGCINVAHLDTLAMHPKLQLIIELDQFDISNFSLKSHDISFQRSSNVPSSQSMPSNSLVNALPVAGASICPADTTAVKKETSPLSGSCEFSFIEPDSTDHVASLSNPVFGTGESIDQNLPWSTSQPADQSTDSNHMVSSSSSSASDLEVNQKAPAVPKKLLDKRLKRLRHELEKNFAESCARFDPESDTVVKFARLQYEKELAQSKRTTLCSVCKVKPCNIHLSLASANSRQWHPYHNNYAFCSASCRSKV